MCSLGRFSGIPLRGLSHSEIPGSKVVCTSPRLFAAYHVLHRLLVPRHPPCALSSLTNTRRFRLPFFYAVVKDQCPNILVGNILLCIQNPTTYTFLLNGADRVRTDDLRLARAALSHLSYSPSHARRRHNLRNAHAEMDRSPSLYSEHGGPKWS
jgi:hypothetical protein